MVIEVVLRGDTPGTRLRAADDFGRFEVRVRAASRDLQALGQALAGIAVFADDDHVFVRSEALVELAGPRSSDWRTSLEAMVAWAGERGWADDSGAIRAHIEWELDGGRVEPTAFRRVLGHFATGVAVITAVTDHGPVGMACNSLTSVSLEPPLIAICPARASETWPRIRATGGFLVNVMASHHEDATRRFARKDVDRFGAIDVHDRTHGIALDDAVAWIECRIDAEHDGGDHTIVVGRVLDLEARDGIPPLVFFGGTYGTFTAGVTA